MRTVLLDEDDPLRTRVEDRVRQRYGRPPEAFGLDRRASTAVAAVLDDDGLAGFGIFRDYRDPRLHLGNVVDLQRLGDVLGRPEVGLYQVALIEAEEGRLADADAARATVGAFREWLGRSFQRYALFITLQERANRRAVPLYHELGFRPTGAPSRLMRLDFDRLARRIARAPALPPDLDPVFLDGATAAQREGLAEAYARVFLGAAGGTTVQAQLDGVLSQPEACPELSLLLVRRGDGRVAGFLLADRPAGDVAHVGVVGVVPECRGQRLPFRSMPLLRDRAGALGVRAATFVTSSDLVVRLVLRAFGATEIDRLSTWFQVG